MRVLITGATGFVGAHLRRYLLDHTVDTLVGTVYPDPPHDPAPSSREHLRYLDLCDAAATAPWSNEVRPDAIVHLAAQSHVPDGVQRSLGDVTKQHPRPAQPA